MLTRPRGRCSRHEHRLGALVLHLVGSDGERAVSRDATGRDANRLIAPSLDEGIARAALGRTTFKGKALADGLVAPMRESRLEDGTAALQANLAADGYVLLRGALPTHTAEQARSEVFEALAGVDEIQRDPATRSSFDGIVTGNSTRRQLYPDDASLGSFWRSVSEGPRLRNATHGAALSEVVGTVLGEAATPHDYLYLLRNAIIYSFSRGIATYNTHLISYVNCLTNQKRISTFSNEMWYYCGAAMSVAWLLAGANRRTSTTTTCSLARGFSGGRRCSHAGWP